MTLPRPIQCDPNAPGASNSDLCLFKLAGGVEPERLLFTRQPRTVHGVLWSAVLAAWVGWVVQPVRS
jgi:hypothetical protein